MYDFVSFSYYGRNNVYDECAVKNRRITLVKIVASRILVGNMCAIDCKFHQYLCRRQSAIELIIAAVVGFDRKLH